MLAVGEHVVEVVGALVLGVDPGNVVRPGTAVPVAVPAHLLFRWVEQLQAVNVLLSSPVGLCQRAGVP
eukprot:3020526-Lingulodinium_polyedra.AAC.1